MLQKADEQKCVNQTAIILNCVQKTVSAAISSFKNVMARIRNSLALKRVKKKHKNLNMK